MKKRTKKKMNKKVWSIIIVICLLIILISTIIVVSKISKNNTNTDRSNVVAKELKELTKEFYEEKYYDTIDVEILKKSKDSGLRVNLKDLYIRCDRDKKIVDPTTGNRCNEEETYAVIYPTEPFGKTDYKVEYTINCK